MADKTEYLNWKLTNNDNVNIHIARKKNQESNSNLLGLIEGSVSSKTSATIRFPSYAEKEEILAIKSDNAFPVYSLGDWHPKIETDDDDYDPSLGDQIAGSMIPVHSYENTKAIFSLVKKSVSDPFSFVAKRVTSALNMLNLNNNRNDLVTLVIRDLKINGLLPDKIVNKSIFQNDIFNNSTAVISDYLSQPYAYFNAVQNKPKLFYVYTVGDYTHNSMDIPDPKEIATISVVPPVNGMINLSSPIGGYTLTFHDTINDIEAGINYENCQFVIGNTDFTFVPGFIKRELIYAGQITKDIPTLDKNALITFFTGFYRDKLVIAIPEKIIKKKSTDDYIKQIEELKKELEKEKEEHEEKIKALQEQLKKLKENNASVEKAIAEATERLKNANQKLQEILKDANHKSGDVKELNDTITKVKNEIKNLQPILDSVQKDAADKQEEVRNINNLIKQLKDTVQQLNNEKEKMTAKKPDNKQENKQVPKKTGTSSLWIAALTPGIILLIVTTVAGARFMAKWRRNSELRHEYIHLNSLQSDNLSEEENSMEKWLNGKSKDEIEACKELRNQVQSVISACTKPYPEMNWYLDVSGLSPSALKIAEYIFKAHSNDMPKLLESFNILFKSDVKKEIAAQSDPYLIKDKELALMPSIFANALDMTYSHYIYGNNLLEIQRFQQKVLLKLDKVLKDINLNKRTREGIIRLAEDTAGIIFRLTSNYDGEINANDRVWARKLRADIIINKKFERINEIENVTQRRSEALYRDQLRLQVNKILTEMVPKDLREGRFSLIDKNTLEYKQPHEHSDAILNIIKPFLEYDPGFMFKMEDSWIDLTIFDLKKPRSPLAEGLFDQISNDPQGNLILKQLQGIRFNTCEVIKNLIDNPLLYKDPIVLNNDPAEKKRIIESNKRKLMEKLPPDIIRCVSNTLKKLHEEYPTEITFGLPGEIKISDKEHTLSKDYQNDDVYNYISNLIADNVVTFHKNITNVEFSSDKFREDFYEKVAAEINNGTDIEKEFKEEIAKAVTDIISESAKLNYTPWDLFNRQCYDINAKKRAVIREALIEIYKKLTNDNLVRDLGWGMEETNEYLVGNGDSIDLSQESELLKFKDRMVSVLTEPYFISNYTNVVFESASLYEKREYERQNRLSQQTPLLELYNKLNKESVFSGKTADTVSELTDNGGEKIEDRIQASTEEVKANSQLYISLSNKEMLLKESISALDKIKTEEKNEGGDEDLISMFDNIENLLRQDDWEFDNLLEETTFCVQESEEAYSFYEKIEILLHRMERNLSSSSKIIEKTRKEKIDINPERQMRRVKKMENLASHLYDAESFYVPNMLEEAENILKNRAADEEEEVRSHTE